MQSFSSFQYTSGPFLHNVFVFSVSFFFFFHNLWGNLKGAYNISLIPESFTDCTAVAFTVCFIHLSILLCDVTLNVYYHNSIETFQF